MGGKRKIGMWLYQNGGGDKIQEKIIKKSLMKEKLKFFLILI